MPRLLIRVLLICLAIMVAIAVAGCAQSSPDATPSPSGSVPPTTIHVASLKGATTMGLVGMMDDPESYLGAVPVTFDVEGTADAITPKLVSGDIDIAVIPANLAAVLYARTGGGIQVTSITALNVLYVVTKGVTVSSVDDLAGQTVYSMGKGTTPQAVVDTILDSQGLLGNVDVQYMSEATEVVAKLSATESGIAILPEPYVSVLTSKDNTISVALDLGAAFRAATGVPVVTAVSVVRTDFAQTHRDAVVKFLAASSKSAEFTASSPEDAARLIAAQGITPTAEIAQAAIPRSGITSVTGSAAKTALAGYLETLYASDPALVGGTLPGDDFYWA